MKYIPDGLPGPSVLDTQISGTESLAFFALGDAGTGDEEQLRVARGMEKLCLEKTNFHGILLLGDNFYQQGVQDINDPQWQSKFEFPYGSTCLAKLPVYAILGNHDYKGNIKAQIDYHQVNPRWNMPHRFYAVTFANLVQIIALDSIFPDLCFSSDHCSIDFLRNRLKKSDFIWNVVIAHSPLYSNSALSYSHRGGILGFIMRPIVCDSLDLWMNGHSHHMEYSKLPGCKTGFVTSGGGGADLYGIRHSPKNDLFLVNSRGFSVLEVNSREMSLSFYDTNGSRIYQSSKTK